MNRDTSSPTWDCIIVGAGPAGLNAALVLGRARWRVLVLDNGSPRNYATHAMHGVLGHDGLDVQGAEVLDAAVRLTSAGRTEAARTVLLATGMLDELPEIPGFADVWATSAHTCPYCDGYEHRDERLAVLAAGDRGEHLAVLLRQWSDDVVLLSNGPHNLAADRLARVQAAGVPVIETPVTGLDSHDGRLRHIRLGDGQTLDRDALFFYVGWRLRTDIARTLGCELRDDGSIAVDAHQATNVDRVHAAGNCSDPERWYRQPPAAEPRLQARSTPGCASRTPTAPSLGPRQPHAAAEAAASTHPRIRVTTGRGRRSPTPDGQPPTGQS
jgi:thioredoxin reductase